MTQLILLEDTSSKLLLENASDAGILEGDIGEPSTSAGEGAPDESFAKRVYELLSPIGAGNKDLRTYVGGIGDLFQEIETYAKNTEAGVGWSMLLDVNRVPQKGFDWLGQFVGVDVDHDDTIQGMRQQIRSHDRWGRGTPLSMVGPASHYLPGDSKLFMSERNPNPWHITFILVDNPTIEQTYFDLWDQYNSYHDIRVAYSTYGLIYSSGQGDWSRVQNAILANKPAGVQVTFIFAANILYLSIYIIEASYQVTYNGHPTYLELYNEAFPDIEGTPPVYRQLVSTRYYRSIWNQFETYTNVLDSFQRY